MWAGQGAESASVQPVSLRFRCLPEIWGRMTPGGCGLALRAPDKVDFASARTCLVQASIALCALYLQVTGCCASRLQCQGATHEAACQAPGNRRGRRGPGSALLAAPRHRAGARPCQIHSLAGSAGLNANRCCAGLACSIHSFPRSLLCSMPQWMTHSTACQT